MSKISPIWVVADAADARRWLAEASCQGPVLALMPVARATLVGTGAVQVDPRSRFTDWAQARTVAAVRRARQRLVAAVAALPDARAIRREIALDHFLRAAYTGYRLWFTLGASGPWMVPEGATWRRCETRDEAYLALLRHMLVPLVAEQAAVARAQTPPFPALYRVLRDCVLRSACRGRIVFVSGARKGMFGLLDTVAAQLPARIVVAQSTRSGWRDYLRLARSAWRVHRGERFLDVSLLAPPRGNATPAADALIASVGDPVIEAAFGHYRDLLAYRLAQVKAVFADARAITAAVVPTHYLSDDASRLSDWALAEACGEAGVMRWLLSRNTHVKPCSRLAEDACHGYFLARHPEGLVDRYVFWSPHGAAAARDVLKNKATISIAGVRAVPVVSRACAIRTETMRRVLVADSFGSWWFTHSWSFQTSDEYIDGLRHVVLAIESIPNSSILIRAKEKRELDVPSLVRLLPKSERLTVKARGGPFKQDLLDCDLLIAFRSTTIEEALHARRPVLLWGGSTRFRYLPSRTKLPHTTDRGAVYAVEAVEHLKPMIEAILAAHAGAPLTDEEIAEHVWPQSVPTIRDFTGDLVGRVSTTPRSVVQGPVKS